jgi:hypothetical protein
MCRKLVLSVCSLLLFIAASPAEAKAQVPSCGNFASFGTQNGAPGYQLFYQLFSGSAATAGADYDAVLAWGDGNVTTASVLPENTTANPVVIDNVYEDPGTYPLSISTSGVLSNGSPCADNNVAIGTVVITAPVVSCGTFNPFDVTNPPGTERLTVGEGITYRLRSQGATITAATLDWGDGTTSVLPGPLAPSSPAFVFPQPPPHTYNTPGTYEVFLLAVAGNFGPHRPCADHRVHIGTVVVTAEPPAPPTAPGAAPPRQDRPLTPPAARRKCDDFLRKASGRPGAIYRRASRPPRTTCGAPRGTVRTCKTTVVVRACRCHYVITTRVPATGRPTVTRFRRKRGLPGGGRPRPRQPATGTLRVVRG